MKSPRERYNNDAGFHQLVEVMYLHIVQAQYTPSEMREAAVLASILYAENYTPSFLMPKEVTDWLDKEIDIMHYQRKKKEDFHDEFSYEAYLDTLYYKGYIRAMDDALARLEAILKPTIGVKDANT